MACVFPTAIAYAETIFPVEGKHVTFFVLGSASGEMALPALISTFFGDDTESKATNARVSQSPGPGPVAMMWIICAGTCLNMLVFLYLVRRALSVHLKIRVDIDSMNLERLPSANSDFKSDDSSGKTHFIHQDSLSHF